MEQIVIIKKDGAAIRLFSNGHVAGVTKAEQVCELLGQDVVNIGVVSSEPLKFEVGDYLEVFGSRYTMNSLPRAIKIHERQYEYELKYEGVQYELIKAQYLDIDETGISTGTTFSLMANLRGFAELIVANAERIYGEGTWILGDVPADTLTQNISFNNETCLQVLQNMCELYEVAFFFDRLEGNRYVLHFRKPETIMSQLFQYGRAKGLYQLERQTVNGKNIITRLFAYGAEKNLPLDYRYGSLRLKMPLSAIHSEGEPFIQDSAAIVKYGEVEGSVNFDEIFPERTGTVTGLDYANRLIFHDASMPFDLNAMSGGRTLYLIPGTNAKVVFKTGNIAGYEFDISSEGGYNHESRRFKLLPYTDSRGAIFPSETEPAFQIQVGDEYTLTDIVMPASYIADAENRLLAKAQDYLAQNSFPRIQYALTVDKNFIEAHTPATSIVNYFKLGDYLQVKDDGLGIDGRVPIQAFTRDILNHYEYSLTLGEEYVSRKGSIYRLRAALGVSRLAVSIPAPRRYYDLSTTVETTEVTLSTWGAVEW